MKLRVSARLGTLLVLEAALIAVAVALATYLRLGGPALLTIVNEEGGIYKALLLASVTQVCLFYADLYDLRLVAERRELFTRMIEALGAASLILAVVYFWFPDLIIGRGVFLISTVIMVLLVGGWRVAFYWLGPKLAPRERLLLVGTGAGALTLARELFDRRHELGVAIVGFVDPDPVKVGQPMINPGIVGTIEDIPAIVRNLGVDRVVVSLADARGKLPMEKLLEMRLGSGVAFDHLATVYEQYTGKIAVENLRPSWLIFAEGFRKTRALSAVKRVMDVVLSVVGLVLLAPISVIVAALVKLTSQGPVFYHQVRVGYQGRHFVVHKFRSMRSDAEAHTGAVWATSKDARVTPLGRWLRSTRLDEVPQLWNVLIGEMSLVGPRPERPEFVSKLTDSIPFYGLRNGVRPGVTGWAQVRYTYGASVEDALEKLQYDLFYMKHVSIALDLLILFLTVKTVLLRRGAQ
jgi:sugar transferase (PEP-CTERM system associated)